MNYWYNVSTGQVESDENRSADADVMGPYASEAEASQALARAKDRTERWDDEDEEWADRGAAPGWNASDEDSES